MDRALGLNSLSLAFDTLTEQMNLNVVFIVCPCASADQYAFWKIILTYSARPLVGFAGTTWKRGAGTACR